MMTRKSIRYAIKRLKKYAIQPINDEYIMMNIDGMWIPLDGRYWTKLANGLLMRIPKRKKRRKKK